MHRPGRGRVVDDVHTGYETQQAQPRQHRLEGSQDGFVLRAALLGPRDLQRGRQRRLETPLGRGHVRLGPQQDIYLIDSALRPEHELRRRKVHHRQLAAKDAGHTRRRQESADGEVFYARGCR